MNLRSLLQDILNGVSSRLISFQMKLRLLITLVGSTDYFRLIESLMTCIMYYGITVRGRVAEYEAMDGRIFLVFMSTLAFTFDAITYKPNQNWHLRASVVKVGMIKVKNLMRVDLSFMSDMLLFTNCSD